MPRDGDRIAEILGRLDPDDAALLRDHLRGSTAASQRLCRRDHAIRAAIAEFWPGLKPRPAAERFASSFGRYLSAGWRIDRQAGHAAAAGLRQALFEVAEISAGRPISWRQLLRILGEERKR